MQQFAVMKLRVAELREIVEEAGQLEVPKLEKNLPVLRNIAYVAPLIGLLGTAIGLLSTFENISYNRDNPGVATHSLIASGLHMSLITTAVGIAIAIPAFTFYAYLVSFAKTLMHDMERAGIEIINIINDARNSKEVIEFREAKREIEQDKARTQANAEKGRLKKSRREADGDA